MSLTVCELCGLPHSTLRCANVTCLRHPRYDGMPLPARDELEDEDWAVFDGKHREISRGSFEHCYRIYSQDPCLEGGERALCRASSFYYRIFGSSSEYAFRYAQQAREGR